MGSFATNEKQGGKGQLGQKIYLAVLIGQSSPNQCWAFTKLLWISYLDNKIQNTQYKAYVSEIFEISLCEGRQESFI